jgi:hypothetical protein
MNSSFARTILVLVASSSWALSVETISYRNYIQQISQPDGATWLLDNQPSASPAGGTLSPWQITENATGADFQLWTVKTSSLTGLTSYLLGTSSVGTYLPVASVTITSEDPYTIIPRTRVGRPFTVTVAVAGLKAGALDPVASKSVTLRRSVQSFVQVAGGSSANVANDTILTPETSITTNGNTVMNFATTMVPGTDPTKVQGEDRFAVRSLDDYQMPARNLSTPQYIQIFPQSTGTITGITEGLVVRFAMPPFTAIFHNCYPGSRNYTQVYKGSPRDGVVGNVIPAGQRQLTSETLPTELSLPVSNYDAVFDSDGVWTMELRTKSVFDDMLLYRVSFTLDRQIEMNGTFTTIE